MDEYLKKEIKKLRNTHIDESMGNDFVLKKVGEKITNSVTPIINHRYIIKFENYIVNPPPNFNLHANWNNGNIPKYNYMDIRIERNVGKMVKIDGVGFDYNNYEDIDSYRWNGFVPLSAVTFIKEVKDGEFISKI